MILLVADLQQLKSDANSPAEGVVIESYVDGFKGPVATVIVQKGVLKNKAVIATDLAAAKIKYMEDFQGKSIDEARESQPAVVLGFNEVPGIGEKFTSYATLEEALSHIKKEKLQQEAGAQDVQTLFDGKFFPIILKGDCFGSLEAIDGMLENLPQEKVILKIVKREVGDVNESDAKLAKMLRAQIIGFRVKVHPAVNALLRAREEKTVRIKLFNVIYELIQDVRNSMEKSLEPEIARQDIGKLKTVAVFWGEKNRQIIGGKITEGELKKGLKIEVMRGEKKIGSGKIVNLQRDKKDVEKLTKGSEAGILFEGSVKVEKGDILVAYTEERRKGEL